MSGRDPIDEIRDAASLLFSGGVEEPAPGPSASPTAAGKRAAVGDALVPTATGREPAGEKLRLGGMALGNGLLVHGPSHWAAAVRRQDGTIAIASGRKGRVPHVDGVPGLRGVVRLAEATSVTFLVKRRLPEARLPFQSPTVLAVGVGAAVMGSRLRRRERTVLGELAGAALSMAPAVAALRGGELASYHGVEHKAIAAYEQGASDAAEAAKEHDRCGSHLITPMVGLNLMGTGVLRLLGGRAPSWGPAVVSVGSIGVAVEVFTWCERHRDSLAARLLRVPGHELQRLLDAGARRAPAGGRARRAGGDPARRGCPLRTPIRR